MEPAMGHVLIHWIVDRHLLGDQVLWFLEWKDAVRLAASCPQLWREVEWMVALAKPNKEAALHRTTPNRLRIPLLTGLPATDVRAHDNRALRFACSSGYLEVAQWLVDRFGLTADDVRARNNSALRSACEYDHLAAARWLVDRFGLTAEDVRAEDNWALRWACYHGHLAVARWLTDRFGLTVEDARACDNWALRSACDYGHLEVARWLVDRFGITRDEID